MVTGFARAGSQPSAGAPFGGSVVEAGSLLLMAFFISGREAVRSGGEAPLASPLYLG